MSNRIVLFKRGQPRGTVKTSESCERVFELVRENKLSRREIAEELGITVRRVQELLDRARAAERDRRNIALAGAR